MSVYLTITPRGPIVARDGRPFGAGQATKMRTVSWPYPQMLAGSARTLLGKLHGEYFPAELLHCKVRGPLPVCSNELHFPVPSDLVKDEQGTVYRSRPDSSLSGASDLPLGAPCVLPAAAGDFKPVELRAFLPQSAMVKWLLEDANFDLSKKLKVPDSEERTHVAIDDVTYSGQEGMLFSTSGLALPEGLTLAASLEGPAAYEAHLRRLHQLHPLGGERRLASWKETPQSAATWDCPSQIRKALEKAVRIRMVLATPAIWAEGWLPGWAKAGLPVPGVRGLKLKLEGSCVNRWKPISGFRVAATKEGPRGPKPVRWAVPAGATYFFRVVEGDPAALADLWLKPMTDTDDSTQESRDGFGLALWGTWSEHHA